MRTAMSEFVAGAQDSLCSALEALDGGRFREDAWTRPGGGGGRTRVLQDGSVFEKAGVSTSRVHGELSPEAARSLGSGRFASATGPLPFFATGLSVVVHPHNPMAPTAHCNWRYFEIGSGQGTPEAWWFGGGADLTPSYLFDDDARHFHGTFKDACDRHDRSFYPRFKRWADEYFVLPHRGECRGVGGIFFDDLCDRPAAELLAFVRDAAAAFHRAFLPLVERRRDLAFTDAHKRWQGLRRGRYVEFNLLFDRGTTFGLRTGGRTESILMSLPLQARWEYDATPAPGSPEARLLDVLRAPQAWA